VLRRCFKVIAGNRRPCRATISCRAARSPGVAPRDFIRVRPFLSGLAVPAQHGSSLLYKLPSTCTCAGPRPRSRDCLRFDHVPVGHRRGTEPNGVHAAVVAPVFVRVQMLRIQRTYDLLITRHCLSATANGRRPRLESSVIFHGRRGSLEMDLWHEEARFRGAVCPVFFSRSGEVIALRVSERGATLITAAVCCIGCHHCHLLQPKRIVTSDDPFVIGAIAGE
jgi:hypothetical protein